MWWILSSYFFAFLVPCDSVVERRPSEPEVAVQSRVRAQAQVVGLPLSGTCFFSFFNP